LGDPSRQGGERGEHPTREEDSMSAKKAAKKAPAGKKRGPKEKRAVKPARQTKDKLGWFPEWGRETRKENYRALLLEPKGERYGGGIFGPLLLGDATPEARSLAGDYLCHIIEHGSVEAIEETFRDLRKLKERAELLKSGGKAPRSASAYYAYSNFIEEQRREPTKAELRRYILARPKRYGDFPPASADSDCLWTDIWKDAGLLDLEKS
jgi:hypothetical protein